MTLRSGLLVVFLFALLAAPALAQAKGVPGAALVETEIARNVAYVGEAITVRLVVLYDRAAFDRSVIQPFQRALDVPVHLGVPWITGIDGTRSLEALPASSDDGLTIALNDDVVTASPGEQRRALGRVFDTLIVTRRFEMQRAGQLVIPAPILRFWYATEFREDFVQGRVPVDRLDAVIHGAPIVLTVLPLPTDGRPDAFTGAIGRFTVSAVADPGEIDVGDTFALRVRIEGDGNWDFAAPRLEDVAEFQAFHVYGVIDELVDGARELTYQIAPMSDAAKAVPAIPFAFFDTALKAPGYRVEWTETIPLAIRPAPNADSNALVGSPASPPPVPPSKPMIPRSWITWLVLGVLSLSLTLRIVRWRRSRQTTEHPDEQRRHEAHAALASFGASSADDLADVFAAVIAAHLKVPVASVISPDLSALLEATGVPVERADAAAALLERLVAARYGGAAPGADDLDAVRGIAEGLRRASS